MSSKITGKQKLVSGFDLNTFVGDADVKIDTAPRKSKAVSPKKQTQKKTAEPVVDLLTERVQVMLTKPEMDALKKKIGMVSTSKWLRHEMKGKGII